MLAKEHPLTDNTAVIRQLKEIMAKFVADRSWQRYHTPKNLSMAIAIETAELMEHYQWLSNESPDKNEMLEIESEVADIFAYLVSFCNVLNIDLTQAFTRKMSKNEVRYPKNHKDCEPASINKILP